MDSNHRRRKPADLQSAPFGHSGNFPSCLPLKDRLAFCAGLPREGFRCAAARVPEDLRLSASLASAVRADGGIRTPDQLITNQLLWPTELHRQNQPFWIAKVGIKNLPAKLFPINFSLFYSSQRTSVYRLFTGVKSGAKIGKVLYFTTASAKNITLRTQGYYRSAPARSETTGIAGAKTLRHLFNI